MSAINSKPMAMADMNIIYKDGNILIFKKKHLFQLQCKIVLKSIYEFANKSTELLLTDKFVI